MTQNDEIILEKLKRFRNNATSRMLWYDVSEGGARFSPFVDKALKIFNLKQVAYEIENSVMSKVSCTACKAGN